MSSMKLLAENTVHLWLLDFNLLTTKQINAAEKILIEHELLNFSKYRFKNRHIAARAMLRLCLSQYTSTKPQDLAFQHNRYGKPEILNGTIGFNLSHSNNFALLAICSNKLIGIDIEEEQSSIDLMLIAENNFHAQEISQLQACDEQDRQAIFLQLWTLKEAFLKAVGLGIGRDLKNIYFEKNTKQFTLVDRLKEYGMEWKFYHDRIQKNCHWSLAINSLEDQTLVWIDANEKLFGDDIN
jgi:4'-phosphopantetheinyl transferase